MPTISESCNLPMSMLCWIHKLLGVQAHIIWAVRHPLDVVLSCFAQPFEGRGTAWAWDMHGISSSKIGYTLQADECARAAALLLVSQPDMQL